MAEPVLGGHLELAFDGPESGPVVVLAHGAGAGKDSDFMSHMARRLADHGVRVVRFDFPYVRAGRRTPDKQAVLESTFEEVLAVTGGMPVVGGKSLGGRIAAHVASRVKKVRAVFFLGYPLHPPGRPDKIRDVPLMELEVPMLFVEGTRDPFCPLPTLKDVLSRVRAPHELILIEDGDHSFKVRRSSGRTTAEAWDEAADGIGSWIGRI